MTPSANPNETQPCHRCATLLDGGPGTFYVVRIEAFADPTPPEITADDLRAHDRSAIDRLIVEAATCSETELMDQVYRTLTLYLCATCYRRWIEDPTGMIDVTP